MRIHWNAQWIQFWHRLTFPVRFIRNSVKYANDNNNADHVENETDLSHIVFNDDNTGKHWITRKSCRRHWSRRPHQANNLWTHAANNTWTWMHDERKARCVFTSTRWIAATGCPTIRKPQGYSLNSQGYSLVLPKLTGVLPACFQVNQVKKPFSSEFFAYVSVAFNSIKQFIENEPFRFWRRF